MRRYEAARRMIRPPRGWPADAAVAIVIAVAQIAGTYFAARRQTPERPLDIVAFALLALGPAVLFWRRRFPLAVLLVVFASTLSYFLLGYPRGPIFLALIVAFVSALIQGRRLPALAVAVAGYFSFLWLKPLLTGGSYPTAAQAVALSAWLLVLIGVGEVIRVRRAYFRAVEQRAVEAERTREEEARRRASEERLRISREVHDIVAHNISLINVQAGVALHLMEENPEHARSALRAIKQASKDVLVELRSTLGALRGSDEAPPRGPAASLAGLDDLAKRVAATGLHVRTHMTGVPRQLPPGVDLAAYRIVQEALTNVARHAGPATATVEVAYGDSELTVKVVDDGRGARGVPAPEGNGIAGMRERAAALGGQLKAGPRPDGGFSVVARLPLERRPGDGEG